MRSSKPNNNNTNAKKSKRLLVVTTPTPHNNKLIHQQTWQAAFILILAIGTSIFWNYQYGENDDDDPAGHGQEQQQQQQQQLTLFWKYHCRIAHCHSSLKSSGRLQIVQLSHTIPEGTMLVEIPRDELITESDARRFLQMEGSSVLDLEQNDYNNDGAVVLAIYLAYLLLHNNNNDNDERFKDLMLKHQKGLGVYLSILPRDFGFHPVLWNETYLDQTLGLHSLTRQRVDRLRQTIDREYYQNRPSVVNGRFFAISYSAYTVARLNVLTRSFGSSNEHAMVPILDLYDHRGRPNVSFRFNTNRNSYQIHALRPLNGGEILYDSYGKRTDSDLFAKYGFVNRDGDDWMDASLAYHHNVFDTSSTEQQVKQKLVQYLQYDDGYDSCVYPENAVSWNIKRQKLQDLLEIAHVEKNWVVRHPPQSELSRRGLDAKGVFATCEIITRTDHPLSQVDVVRTALCVVRLAEMAHQRLSSSSSSSSSSLQMDVVQSELETLQAVRIAALRSIHGMDQRDAKMRREPCPPQAVVPLL